MDNAAKTGDFASSSPSHFEVKGRADESVTTASDVDNTISKEIPKRISKDEAVKSIPGCSDGSRKAKLRFAKMIRKLPGAKKTFKKTFSPLNEATTYNALLSAIERADHHGNSYHDKENQGNYRKRRLPASPVKIPVRVHDSAYVKVKETDRIHGKMDKGILRKKHSNLANSSGLLKDLPQLNSTVGAWTTYKVDGNGVKENAVDPTSDRTGNPALDHLHNININIIVENVPKKQSIEFHQKDCMIKR